MYSEKELRDNLSTKIFGSRIYTFEKIDSTNSYAKYLASNGADEGTVVVADYQTAGRGRLGRRWIGEQGKNLLLSVIIKPPIENNKLGLLPIFASVGVALSIETITNKQCECKWPNDLLIHGRKLCGILIESSFQNNFLEYAIVGMGLNVNQESFDNNLDGRATSLFIECKKTFEIKSIFSYLMSSLESFYLDIQKNIFERTIYEWKLRTRMFGKIITLEQLGIKITGKAVGISEDGGLVIETPKGNQTFYAGDVTIQNQIAE